MVGIERMVGIEGMVGMTPVLGYCCDNTQCLLAFDEFFLSILITIHNMVNPKWEASPGSSQISQVGGSPGEENNLKNIVPEGRALIAEAIIGETYKEPGVGC